MGPWAYCLSLNYIDLGKTTAIEAQLYKYNVSFQWLKPSSAAYLKVYATLIFDHTVNLSAFSLAACFLLHHAENIVNTWELMM